MNVESAHARALPVSRSLHNLSLAPEPSSINIALPVQRHRRQRSASDSQTFVSAAVVPHQESTEILSSLINSLTVLSDSAREQLRQAKELQATIVDVPHPPDEDNSLTPNRQNEVESRLNSRIGVTSDQDIAEAPVVGYARGQPKIPKRSRREKWAVNKSHRLNQSKLAQQEINQIPPMHKANESIGVPSIERPATALSSITRPASKGTSRGPSLDFARTDEVSGKSSLKMLFSRESESHIRKLSSPGDSDMKSLKALRSRRKVSKQSESNKENLTPTQVADTTPRKLREKTLLVASSPGAKLTYNPLDPSNREDLSDHLIPSRKSSLRHRPGTASSIGKQSAMPTLHSIGSGELKNLEVDADDFEEEDSTLRRIRELQRAREKRQTEWLNDSQKLDGASKHSFTLLSQHRRDGSAKESRKSSIGGSGEISTDKSIPKVPSISAEYNHEPSYVSTKSSATPVASSSSPIISSFITSKNAGVVISGVRNSPSPSSRHKRTDSGNLDRTGSPNSRTYDEMENVSGQVDSFLTAPRLTQRIRHPRTGRTIAFSEVGDPNGFVVFVCVGMGLTRFVTSFYDDVARTQKLRLITPDRPGIGESSAFPDGVNTPLAWADDVAVICHTLNIQKFSLLAHSAGTIYALATALKMPTYVRGRIHLLAPWIPPSQMVASGESNGRIAMLPTSHKILSMLPAPFLRAANSRFLSSSSASLESKGGRKKTRSKSAPQDTLASDLTRDVTSPPILSPTLKSDRDSVISIDGTPPKGLLNRIQSPPSSPSPLPSPGVNSSGTRKPTSPLPPDMRSTLTPQARAALYNTILTHRTWTLATTNANPATDLLVCLERRRSIGFFYRDVIRGVVIHHGRNDTRVPLENVRWLVTVMKRCELRILEDEGHGLLGSAKVMSEVLAEVGREWEEWETIARNKERRRAD